MLRVDATRPPTSTRAPVLNSTPFGLTSQTWPLARSAPSMTVVSLPTTRFRTTDDASGCRNCTVAFAPILKFCQLMAARDDVWLTVMADPLVLMFAWPATMVPPVGNASVPACALAAPASNTLASSAPVTPDDLPRALAISETVTKHPSRDDQILR